MFIISLFFSALGVAFTKHGELGVSPISSVANVVSYKWTTMSLGNLLIIWNCLLILGQILIWRKKFQPIQFLQIPLSFLFGWFTDLGMKIVDPIPVNSYPLRLLMIVIGVVVLSFGVALSLFFYHFKIVGTREGTLISALCTGFIVKFFTEKMDEPMNRVLAD